MDREPIQDDIHRLLQQPMGPTAAHLARAWLQRYRLEALTAVHQGQTPQERLHGVRLARQRLLEDLQSVLPGVIERERLCEEAVTEAMERAQRTYRERFEHEISQTLLDEHFDRPMAERIARAELFTFRNDLEKELRELIDYHRNRLK